MADFSHMRGKIRPAEERFWEKVEKRKGDECWLWIARIDRKGYGQFRFEGRQQRAHRVSFFFEYGYMPDLQLDHLCRNRACVNPVHLEPVTQTENLLRGDTITAANAAKTHCPKGHEYTRENTYARRGARECRTCHANVERERRRLARSVAA